MKHRCPICKKTTDSETDRDFPFCSERCRAADLGAWASEKYVVSDSIFDEEELERVDRELSSTHRSSDDSEDSSPEHSNDTIH